MIEKEEKFEVPEKFLEDSGKVLRNYNTRSNNKDTHKKDVENCEEFRKNLDALFQFDEGDEVQEPISEDENELNKSKISTNGL